MSWKRGFAVGINKRYAEGTFGADYYMSIETSSDDITYTAYRDWGFSRRSKLSRCFFGISENGNQYWRFEWDYTTELVADYAEICELQVFGYDPSKAPDPLEFVGDNVRVKADLYVEDNLIVTTSIDTPEISNTAGDLKIQPDVQGDVTLFEDTDVGDEAVGKSFYIHRKAAEGDQSFRMHLDQYGRTWLTSSDTLMLSGGLMLKFKPILK